MRGLLDKLAHMKLERSWQWLLYLDLILPGVLFLLALLLPQADLAAMLARLFHSYSMYVSSPIPNLATFMGVVGMVIHFGALGYAVKQRDRIDFVLTASITLSVTLYYYYGINYELVRLLNFY